MTQSRTRRWRIVVMAVAAVTTAGACAARGARPHGSPLRQLTTAQRAAAIERAHVWTATDIPAMNIRAGPEGPGALAPFAAVTCTYVERKMSGNSPKFTCELAPGDQVKVKYGTDNVEVYGVVAASRLAWALGFGADRWYPVTVTCHGCPADPQKDPRTTNADAVFETAAIERTMTGTTMETRPDEGWRWSELESIEKNADVGSKAHRDALKLLAVVLQHSDSKSQQQRLICVGEAGIEDPQACDAPFMLIHDVGLTFGRANRLNRNSLTGVNLARWAATPVWRDSTRCIGNLPASWTGTLDNPVIGEAGRKFLADLLVQLSDTQLRDLFEVARFPQRSHTAVEAWVDAFKKKRAEIVGASCPS